MSDDVLSDRALNRATLDRQRLLRRHDRPMLDAVHHLVGLQGPGAPRSLHGPDVRLVPLP